MYYVILEIVTPVVNYIAILLYYSPTLLYIRPSLLKSAFRMISVSISYNTYKNILMINN